MATPDEKFTQRMISVIEDAGGAVHIARELEISPGTVRLWRHGSKPYPHHLKALCEKFSIDLQWLKTGEPSTDAQQVVSLAQSVAAETPRSGVVFDSMSDDDLAARVVEMVKTFARVPSLYTGVALTQLRAGFGEFLRRAERRAGGEIKYPKTRNGKKP